VIIGVHAIIFTRDAAADRAFLRDVLDLPSVDAGRGWLIFALPPAELAAHPTDEDAHHELYLMCDDVRATIEELRAKGVEFTREISDAGFGLMTAFRLPGGSEIALYEPRHPSPIAGDTSRMPAPLIEFPADDPDRARRFWHGVLGVTLAPRPARAGSGWQADTEGLRLGVHERGPGPGDTASLPYFTVADLATALERVLEFGGSIIHPGDRWAVCRDSEGSPFALAAAPAE
jgi:predicted enzyme related to lactoylglutathione lyase